MATVLNFIANNEAQTHIFSQQLAKCCHNINHTIVIYLEGNLGAGKTTLARGFIQFFGFERVKSPTYTLVESYQNNLINIHHFDCYRLSNPEELEYIGIRDYLATNHIQLIEWPSLGHGVIAKADISITLSGNHTQRNLAVCADTSTGRTLLSCVKNALKTLSAF